MKLISFICLLLLQILLAQGINIEGTIIAPADAPSNWAAETKVRVDGSRYLGFVKRDGSFVVSDVGAGSYLVEFTNPIYLFQVLEVSFTTLLHSLRERMALHFVLFYRFSLLGLMSTRREKFALEVLTYFELPR